MTQQFKAKACAPGIGIGPVSVLPELFSSENQELRISKDEVQSELDRFHEALDEARNETEEVQRRTDSRLYEQLSQLFSMQKMILDDPLFVNEVEQRIRKERNNAEAAVIEALEQIHSAFSDQFSDDATRGRMLDVVDVGWRVLRHLNTQLLTPRLPHRGILVARNLSPGIAVRLEETEVDGLITSNSNPGSHVSIVAQAMNIPAVSVSDDGFFNEIEPGDQIVVSANQGRVILSPTESQLDDFSQARDRLDRFNRQTRDRARSIDNEDLPCAIRGNIGLSSEVSLLKDQGGHGAGLIRTELLFMGDDSNFPSRERQFTVYQKLAEAVSPYTASFRTFDFGGDKERLVHPEQPRQSRGRGIQRSLKNSERFQTQLKALLEAYRECQNIKILIPMVGGPEEIQAVREHIEQLSNELNIEPPPLGVMVEIPSIVYMLDDVTDSVDFLTVGTNDLTHYLMGADRFEEGDVDVVEAPAPALFRCLEQIFQKANQSSSPVGVCGELAGNPVFSPVLLGMGVHELSMAPIRIPEVKLVAKNLTEAQCKEASSKILEFDQRKDLKRWVRKDLAPEIHGLLEM